MGFTEEESANANSKEEDNDEETIRGISLEPTTSVVDTSIFDVLSEFKLDLCLSPPTSPTPSTSTNLPPPPSPPTPSSPILSRSFSFSSEKTTAEAKKPVRKPSRLAATVPVRSRGSWPLLKYTGRGTPIDRRRRLEWGGFSTEEVTEEGILFSTVRSSEDSTAPEWVSVSSSQSEPRPPSIHDPPPELGPLGIENPAANRSAEWDSIMKSVLATAAEQPPITTVQIESGTSPQERYNLPDESSDKKDNEQAPPPVKFSIMSKEQVEELNTGLETGLGLNASLDLGLGNQPGSDAKWFDLRLLPPPSAPSRCSSPSVYSVATPRRLPSLSPTSDQRSTSSTKAEGHGRENGSVIVGHKFSDSWWRRMLGRLRKVQVLFAHPRNLF